MSDETAQEPADTRNREWRLREFVDNSYEAIWCLELDDPIDTSLPLEEQIRLIFETAFFAECNDVLARSYGLERARDAIGIRLSEIFGEAKTENDQVIRRFVRERYRLRNFQTRETDVDGRSHVFLNSCVGILEHGALQRIWGTHVDISDQVRSSDAIRRLNRRLLSAQEEVSSRIARELHDDLGQQLALISIQLDVLQRDRVDEPTFREQLGQLADRVNAVSTAIHQLSHRLHPAKLDRLGIAVTVHALCRELEEHSDLVIESTVDGDLSAAAPAVQLCFYRMAQEALRNSIKHGGASAATVHLWREDQSVGIRVTDDGKGFDTSDPKHEQGLGLISMEERARLVGGRIVIESTPSRGTSVELTVPLRTSACTTEKES